MIGKSGSKAPGLIPGARFVAVNVFFTNKRGELETDTAHLTEALDALEGEKAQIVNMSLVGPRDELVRNRIVDMARKGVVFVGAAGNGGPDAPAAYPAAYEEVIAVTAVDRKGGNYDYANRGDYIDVAAPGVQIWTALPDGGAGFLSGTSFAAPFATAVAAVVYQDTGLEQAVRAGRGPLDPKRVMLAHLFSKGEQKKRDPIRGMGVIKAPSTCGAVNVSMSQQLQPWASIVKPMPSTPVSAALLARPPAASVAQDGWQSVIQRASLPSEAAR
jgi:subtilisin family serine protease